MKNFLKYTLFAGAVLGVYLLVKWYLDKYKKEQSETKETIKPKPISEYVEQIDTSNYNDEENSVELDNTNATIQKLGVIGDDADISDLAYMQLN